jgi:NAD(P)-dependent dehydrogenase (short-subunit alcohol dehydrogenase family)
MHAQRVAAVLGVGPGIGTAVAIRFGREGYAVAVMARSKEALVSARTAAARAGGRSVAIQTDATDPASLATAFQHLRSEVGMPEVFIYNAGAFHIGGILDIAPDLFEQSWKANCFGAFLAAQQVLPDMVECRRGTIIFSGATASLRGSANFACLAVGKFGLRALAQSMAREFGPQGIHVAHVVIDGTVDTPRVRGLMPNRPVDTLLAPDDIAETYWQLHIQPPSTWTHECDLRPSAEKF